MPRLSVIIPAYNAEPFIQQCVESIVSQSIKEIEIIAIDDGSTDSTGLILDRLANQYDNIKVIHQNNKGLYATRKKGLEMASGEYIGWVDADDYIDEKMYEYLIYAAIANDSDLAYCDYKWVPDKPQNKEKWFRPYIGKKDVSFVERNSQPWNKIVRKQLLERLDVANCFESCFDEIYIRVLLEAKNPVSVDKELYNYRVVQDSMSTDYRNIRHYKQFVEASKALQRVMDTTIRNNVYWKSYFEYRIIYYLIVTMIVSANARNKAEYREAREYLLDKYPKYKKNMHFFCILKRNYNPIKALVLGTLIPSNYSIAKAICSVGMR